MINEGNRNYLTELEREFSSLENDDDKQDTPKSGLTQVVPKIKKTISGIRRKQKDYSEEEIAEIIESAEKFTFKIQEDPDLEVRRRKKRYGPLIGALALFLLAASNPRGLEGIAQAFGIQDTMDISNDEEVLKITAIDYRAIPNSGWGDGIMLSSNGYHLLMDTFREQCRASLDKYLQENNITKFDIYISHDHHDHADNLEYLAENYDVSKVYIPKLDRFDNFSVEKLKNMGVDVIPLEKGMTFEIGGPNCVAEVIYGPDKIPEDVAKNMTSEQITNNMSLVTMIRTKTRSGEVKYLTGGDIEEYSANKILEQGIDIEADIMKGDHHGGGDIPKYIKKVSPSFYIIDLLRPYDNWVQPQVDAAEECGNVFSTYNNRQISLSIKGSGEIVPTLERNAEPVEFKVQDALGKTYTVTYNLNKDSSHILTEQMKEAAKNKTTESTFEIPKTDGTPIKVSSSQVLEKTTIKNTKTNIRSSVQGFTFIDDNHFAIAETTGYISIYDMSGKMLSTTKADTHNNSLLFDKDKSVIVSLDGSVGVQHHLFGVNPNSYELSSQKPVENRSNGNAIGIDSYGSKDYIITIGRRKRSYLFKRHILWDRK